MSQIAGVSMPKARSWTKTDVQQMLLHARAFIVLIVVFIVFAFIAPNFLDAANIEIMAKHVALNAILGIGMTFVILTGGIDLSVGSIVGLTAMIAGLLINEGMRPADVWRDRLSAHLADLCDCAGGRHADGRDQRLDHHAL